MTWALRGAFIGSSVAWASALPLATLAASHRFASSAVYLLTVAVYAIGSVVCHQRPERSFFLWAHQMPVCARCAGIYVGAALGVLVLASRKGEQIPLNAEAAEPAETKYPTISSRVPGVLRSNGVFLYIGSSPARTALAVAALPTVLTLLYEWTTGQMPSNAVRALAGLPLGAAVSWIVIR